MYTPPGLLRPEYLPLNQDDPSASHFGAAQTLELRQRKYHWPGMTKDFGEYVETYDKCHRIQPVKHKPNGKLDSLDTRRDPFTDLTMGFITDMPQCEYHQVVYDSVFFIIDRYTKMAGYIAARMDRTAKRLAQAFLEQVWRDKGLPDSIVSDRRCLFTSKFWSALYFYLKIKHYSPPFVGVKRST